ncbi:MAG: hypothetical protein ACREBG_15050 [Pyrinomonadaceae bacterium]
MVRLMVIASLSIAAFGAFGCQKYTTTLEQSPGRVDEGIAISTLRSIAAAQTAFSVSNSGDYGSFEQLAGGSYLDERFNSGQPKIYGFVFTMSVSPRSSATSEGSYQCNADPDKAVNAAGRHFYISSSSVGVHVNATGPATANDENLQP